MEVKTILWREYIFFKRRFWKITSAALVSPILYLIAFGWGLGGELVVEGHSYLAFIMPGVIALTTMRQSFNSISMRVSVSRLHEKSFEYYLISPTRMSLLTLGHVIAGALRGMYTGIVILIIAWVAGIPMDMSFNFFLIMLLNSLMFSSLGFFAAMAIDTHYDLNRFTTFVINPMSFLCGTFFSLRKMPYLLRMVIEILPFTHSVRAIRSVALNNRVEYFSILLMIFFTAAFYMMSVKACYKEAE